MSTSHKPTEEGSASCSGSIGDSKRALLKFMKAATPNDQVLQDILVLYDRHLSNMILSFETHLVGDHSVMTECIDDVPDTVSPVKAKLPHVQVVKGDSSETRLEGVLTGTTASALTLIICAGTCQYIITVQFRP